MILFLAGLAIGLVAGIFVICLLIIAANVYTPAQYPDNWERVE